MVKYYTDTAYGWVQNCTRKMDRKRDLVWLISFTASKCHQYQRKGGVAQVFYTPIYWNMCAVPYGITPKNVPFQRASIARCMIECCYSKQASLVSNRAGSKFIQQLVTTRRTQWKEGTYFWQNNSSRFYTYLLPRYIVLDNAH